MTRINRLCMHVKRLLACERGAVAPLVGLCAMMLIGAVALAVDIGRAQVAQSKLQASLDSAGLAAGAMVGQNLDEDLLRPEARQYLDANFNGKTIDASICDTCFDLDLSEDEMVVTLEATATLPTTFMRIFGKEEIQVAARSEITREMTGLEVALVVDVTGSMCDPCQKLADLKTAAHDLMNVLFGQNSEVEDLWVGIVPFSQTVNVGTSHANWTSDYTQRATKDNCIGPTGSGKCPTTGNNGRVTMSSLDSVTRPPISTRTSPVTLVDDWMTAATPNSLTSSWRYAPHAWSGCLEERFDTGDDVTNATPEDSPFRTYFYPDVEGYNNWINNSPNEDGNVYNDGRKRISSSRSANKGCPPTVVTALTNQKATLTAAIDALDAEGNTHINVGAVWGWRLLSPEWKSAWGGSMQTNDLPKAWDDPESQKAVVIMTDGKNTMTKYTAFGLVDNGELGASDLDNDNDDIFEQELNARTLAVCSAMKDAGIIVYTVLFQTTEDTVKDMLRDCASKEVFFFDTTTGQELASAFKTIGDSLSKLRVSQ